MRSRWAFPQHHLWEQTTRRIDKILPNGINPYLRATMQRKNCMKEGQATRGPLGIPYCLQNTIGKLKPFHCCDSCTVGQKSFCSWTQEYKRQSWKMLNAYDHTTLNTPGQFLFWAHFRLRLKTFLDLWTNGLLTFNDDDQRTQRGDWERGKQQSENAAIVCILQQK